MLAWVVNSRLQLAPSPEGSRRSRVSFRPSACGLPQTEAEESRHTRIHRLSPPLALSCQLSAFLPTSNLQHPSSVFFSVSSVLRVSVVSVLISDLLCFLGLRLPHNSCVHHRNALNSFPFMRVRTTSFATEGWGMIPASFPSSRTPSPSLLFSITYALPNLQVFCFDNVATVPGGVYPPIRTRCRNAARN